MVVDLLRRKAVKAVGWDGKAGVVGVGEFVVWGSDFSGQMGLSGKGRGGEVGARRVVVGEGGVFGEGLAARVGVAAVATGVRHTLFVAENGELWVSGGRKWGVLGLGGGESGGRSGEAEVVVCPVRVGGELEGKTVLAAAASARRSACVTDGGELFVWGGGEGEDVPQRVVKGGVRGVAFESVAVGDSFWLAVGRCGGLWACGENEGGVLGVGVGGAGAVVGVPRKVTRVCNSKGGVRRVFVGSGRRGALVVAALMRQGCVLLWGPELGDSVRSLVLKEDEMVAGGAAVVRVADVGVGEAFVVLVSANGGVYFCDLRAGSGNGIGRGTLFANRVWCVRRRAVARVSVFGRRVVLLDRVGDVWEAEVREGVIGGAVRVEGVRGAVAVDVGKTHAVCVVAPANVVDDSGDAVHMFCDDDPAWLDRAGTSWGAGLEREEEAAEGRDWARAPRTRARYRSETGCRLTSDMGQPQDGQISKPQMLRAMCEDVMLAACSVSTALELLRYAIDMYAYRMQDECLGFLRLNLDRALLSRGGIDTLLAYDAEHLRVLETFLRGEAVVKEEERELAAAEEAVDKCRGDLPPLLSSIRLPTGAAAVVIDPYSITEGAAAKRLRMCRKKLDKIERLQQKLDSGEHLDREGLTKVEQRGELEREAEALLAYAEDKRFAPPAVRSDQPAVCSPGMQVDSRPVEPGTSLDSAPPPPANLPADASSRAPRSANSFSPVSVPLSTSASDHVPPAGPMPRSMSVFTPLGRSSYASAASSEEQNGGNRVTRSAGAGVLNLADSAARGASAASPSTFPSPTPSSSSSVTPSSSASVARTKFQPQRPPKLNSPSRGLSFSDAESPSPGSKRRGKNRGKTVLTVGAMQTPTSCAASSPVPVAGSASETKCSSFTPSSPHAQQCGSSSTRAWGAPPPPPKQKLTLKPSQDSSPRMKQSLIDIQMQQERSKASSTGAAQTPPARHVPHHLSSSPFSPPDTPGSGQIAIAALIQRSAPQKIPGSRDGKSRKGAGGPSAASATTGATPNAWSPATSAWSAASGGSDEGRSSFREIQLAEAEESLHRGSSAPFAASASSPRQVWMPLLGDYVARGKSLKRIEEEELARREGDLGATSLGKGRGARR